MGPFDQWVGIPLVPHGFMNTSGCSEQDRPIGIKRSRFNGARRETSLDELLGSSAPCSRSSASGARSASSVNAARPYVAEFLHPHRHRCRTASARVCCERHCRFVRTLSIGALPGMAANFLCSFPVVRARAGMSKPPPLHFTCPVAAAPSTRLPALLS